MTLANLLFSAMPLFQAVWFQYLLNFKNVILQKEGTIMPNWCETEIKIVGPKEEIIHLNNLIDEATNKPGDYFARNWLGNIKKSRL